MRSVTPSLVFELGFEGINRSARHKSGIAVRFPRMLRIRDDKPLHEADTLQTLEALLRVGESPRRPARADTANVDFSSAARIPCAIGAARGAHVLDGAGQRLARAVQSYSATSWQSNRISAKGTK